MAHKVHPKIFRVRETKDWNSRWFDKKNFSGQLKEDYIIREFLGAKLIESGIESIEIERFAGKLIIIVNSSRPGLIIGRGGSGIEELRNLLKKKIERNKEEIRLEIREVKNIWTSAQLTAQWMAQQLERRMPHRRVMKQALGKVLANKEIEGVKLEVAGRLGGADIARRDRLSEGKLPLQTMRAHIDYAGYEAKTKYGIVGVKVWMYKGEQFD
jgi:small subunit ribosomal protein S3